MAEPLGATVVAVHSLTFGAELVHDIPPMGLTEWRRDLEKCIVDTWCAPLRAAGLPHLIYVVERPLPKALATVADLVGAGRIVVGVRAHKRHTHIQLIVTAGRCPVVTVPEQPVGT